MPNTIITETGSYIPTVNIANEYFLDHEFYDADKKKLEKSNAIII